MEPVPSYVSIVFILTTFAAVGFLLQAVKSVGLRKLPSQILIFLLPLWIFFQAVISMGGFYQNASSMPPRIVLFGVLPAVLTIVAYFIFFRESFIDKVSLRLLTMLHIIRIPVEIVLLWLFQNGQVPQLMTFEGRNFDIVSGILAPIVYLITFHRNTTKRGVLIAYNILGLILLANIVTIAALSIASPIQQLAFDQPNRAVTFFPYSWLPSLVVPIVLFSHLAALWKLFRNKTA